MVRGGACIQIGNDRFDHILEVLRCFNGEQNSTWYTDDISITPSV